jgi:hypothetical protein
MPLHENHTETCSAGLPPDRRSGARTPLADSAAARRGVRHRLGRPRRWSAPRKNWCARTSPIQAAAAAGRRRGSDPASGRRDVAAICRLAPRRRAAIVLRYDEGLSEEHAAARMDTTPRLLRADVDAAMLTLRTAVPGVATRGCGSPTRSPPPAAAGRTTPGRRPPGSPRSCPPRPADPRSAHAHAATAVPRPPGPRARGLAAGAVAALLLPPRWSCRGSAATIPLRRPGRIAGAQSRPDPSQRPRDPCRASTCRRPAELAGPRSAGHDRPCWPRRPGLEGRRAGGRGAGERVACCGPALDRRAARCCRARPAGRPHLAQVRRDTIRGAAAARRAAARRHAGPHAAAAERAVRPVRVLVSPEAQVADGLLPATRWTASRCSTPRSATTA